MGVPRKAARRTPKWLPWSVLLLAAGVGAWLFVGSRDGEGPGLVGEDLAEEASAAGAGGPTLAGRGAQKPEIAVVAKKFDGSIRCVVLDAGGKPAAGIAVTTKRSGAAWSQDDPTTWGGVSPAESLRRTLADLDAPKVGEEKPDASATTDAEGKALLSVAEPGNYDVHAHPEPPLWSGSTQVVVDAAHPQPGVVLKLATGKAFRGRVVDAKDLPVAAVVAGAFYGPTFSMSYLSVPNTATDKTTGDFTWPCVPDGKGSITVRVPGKTTFYVSVTTPRDDVFVIRIPPGAVVTGKVSDAAGAPVAGADLTVATTGAQGGTAKEGPKSASSRGKTGPDGTYRIEDVIPGKVTGISVLAEGFLAKTDTVPLAKWSGAEAKVGAEAVVDVVLGHGGAIAGRVSEPGGKPIEGADVFALMNQSRWGEKTPTATTDAQGRFRMEDVPFGRYALAARSATHYMAALAVEQSTAFYPGDAGLGAPLVVVSKEGETVTRDLEMRPGLTVKGHVVGPDKAPVAGAKIRAANYGLQQVAWRWGANWQGGADDLTVSAQDGSFSIENLPPRDKWNFQAVKPPLTSVLGDAVKLVAGEPAPDVTLRMDMGATLAGRVLDVDGQLVAGQQIQWYSNEANGLGGWGDTRTEPDGSFRLTGVSAGSVVLNTWGSGGSENISLQIDPPLKAGEVREGLELKGKRTVKVSGTVVDAEGKPVASRRVFGQGTGSNQNLVQGYTNEDGAFTIAGLTEGNVRVGLGGDEEDSWGFAGETISVKAPAEGVKIVAAPRVTTVLFGRIVMPDGALVPLCTLRTGGQDPNRYYRGGGQSTGEVVGGEFRREFKGGLPISVTVSSPRGSMGETLNARSKTVKVTDASAEVVITLEPGLEIRGRVVDAKEEGVEGVTLRCDSGSVMTDANGAFRLQGLGEGEVTLSATPPRKFAPPASVKASPGQTDLVIRLKTGACIGGKVIGPDGTPRSNVTVQVVAGGQGYAQANADGTFRIEGLPDEGTVDLYAMPWTPSGDQTLRYIRIKGVRIGTEDLVIRLEVGVSITGVVLDADGKPAEDVQVNAQAEDGYGNQASPDSDGKFELKALGAQPYSLTVTRRNTGAALGTPLRVEAPASNVRLILPARAKIRGRIAGQGTQGFSVWAFPTSAENANPIATTSVGADSTFTLDVPGDVTYTINALRPEDDRFGQVRGVRPGAEITVNLEAGLQIEGVIEDASGKALASVYIAANTPGWVASARSGTDGTFRVRGLPPGKYTLTLYTNNGMEKIPEPIEAGASGQRLKFTGSNR